ncbi:MAG: pseudouridine synthase [Bacteroidota bacterium]
MKYFAINKPFGMLSQFTREIPTHHVLGDLYDFPKDVYPVGRLDRDSEGLLLLTNDKQLHTRLLHPQWRHVRTYWVQVEGIPTEKALETLRNGVTIRAKGKSWLTQPASAKIFAKTPQISPRNPPIRVRKNIPDRWISLSLSEGKNRQVRRMCAAVGFPVLRLIRYSIESLTLEHLEDEPVMAFDRKQLFRLLKLAE